MKIRFLGTHLGFSLFNFVDNCLVYVCVWFWTRCLSETGLFCLDNCVKGCILQIRIVPVGEVSYLQQQYLIGFPQWVRSNMSR